MRKESQQADESITKETLLQHAVEALKERFLHKIKDPIAEYFQNWKRRNDQDLF